MKKTTFFKSTKLLVALVAMVCFFTNQAMAQNYSVNLIINYPPEIVANTQTGSPNGYNVCKNLPANLKTLYISHVDTNSVPLADAAYTVVFSTTVNDFTTTPIASGTNYAYTLTTDSIRIYARINVVGTDCSKDTSFVLRGIPEPTFSLTSATVTGCQNNVIDLTSYVNLSSVQNVTNWGTMTDAQKKALFTFAIDSSFAINTIIPNPTFNIPIGTGTADIYVRLTDPSNSCYNSDTNVFELTIIAEPTVTIAGAVSASGTEVCDSTTVNLNNFVGALTPGGAEAIFSLAANFATTIEGAAASAYKIKLDNTAQQTLKFYVRSRNSVVPTACMTTQAKQDSFNIIVNPVPTFTLNTTATNLAVCDSSTINLEERVTGITAGATYQFSTTADFATILEGTAATAYKINIGNTASQTLPIYVRAKMTATSCAGEATAVQTFDLSVNPAPAIQTITAGLANGCSGNVIAYEIPTQATVTYTWSASGGTVAGSGVGNKDSITWGTANATAQVQVVYTLTTGGKACSRTALLGVDVKQSPTQVNLTAANSGVACDNGSNQIQLQAAVANGTAPYIIDYVWSPGTGSASTSAQASPVTFDVTLANKGTTYNYRLIKVTDSNGCKFIIP